MQDKVFRIITNGTEIENIDTEPAANSDDSIVEKAERNSGKPSENRRFELNLINGAEDDALSVFRHRSDNCLITAGKLLCNPKKLIENLGGIGSGLVQQGDVLQD